MITLLALLALAQAPIDGAALEDPNRSVQWARKWSDTFEEARLRNVPVLVFLTSDN